jgi:hypothetical protein
MSHEMDVLFKVHGVLLALDERAAERVRVSGCPRCAGRLDVANYPRKARGLGADGEAAGEYEMRFSLCCSRDGCRRRATPPSVRFLGRKVYAALAVLLVSAGHAADAGSPPAIAVTRDAPSWATRRRYRFWWTLEFFATPWFAEMAGHFAERLVADDAPASLLERFVGSLCDRVVGLLRLVSPLTTRSVAPETSRLAMGR